MDLCDESAVVNAQAARGDSVVKGTSATLLASLVSMLVAMVVNIVLARALGPEFKGHVDLINATIGLAVTVFGLSLASGVTYVVARGGVHFRRLAAILAAIAAVQGAVVWLALTAVSHTQANRAFFSPEYVHWGALAVGVATFATLLTGYWRAFLSALQKFVAAATLEVISRVLVMVAVIGGVICAGKNKEAATAAAIVGIVTAYVLTALGAPAFVLRHASASGGSSKFPAVWRYSLPCYGGNLVQFLNYRLDVFLVAYFRGAKDVALYVMAVSVAQLLWIPSSALQVVLFPRLTSMGEDGRRAADTAQLARIMLALTFGLGLIMALLAPWVIPFLFGGKFAPSVLPLWLLVPGIVAFCIPNVLAAFIYAIGKPSINMAIALVALVVTVALNLLLLPRIGMIGAAITSSVSYATSSVLTLWVFQGKTRVSLRDTLVLRKSDVSLLLARAATSWRTLATSWRP